MSIKSKKINRLKKNAKVNMKGLVQKTFIDFDFIKSVDVPKVTKKIIAAAKTCGEMGFREEIWPILRDDILKPLGVQYDIKKSAETRFQIAGSGAMDKVLGYIIIEYESPGNLRIPSKYKHALHQLIGEKDTKGYMEKYSKDKSLSLSDIQGVLLDGESIGFVRWAGEGWDDNLFYVNEHSIRQFVIALYGTVRRLMDSNTLNASFGPGSELARTFVGTLYKRLTQHRSNRMDLFYDEWIKLFKIIYGETIKKKSEEVGLLSKLYGIEIIELEEFLFALFTYYAIIVKLLASEIATYYRWSSPKSFWKQCIGENNEQLLESLKELEAGVLFEKLNIRNYLDGDFFQWYLSTWNEEIALLIRRCIEEFNTFDPGTVMIRPEKTFDLLKHIYQYLIPTNLRRKLGEFYTPEWLAALTLKKANYRGQLEKRVLDPSCGSGTFLILSMRAFKKSSYLAGLSHDEIAKKMLQQFVGYDLNPIAVLTARTSFLIELSPYLSYINEIFIPIYFCDSIQTPELVTKNNGRIYQVRTVGNNKFTIPEEIVRDRKVLEFMKELEIATRKIGRLSSGPFVKRVEKILSNKMSLAGEQATIDIFEEIVNLVDRDLNGIWTKIIVNLFAPHFQKRFDFVVGNPPWINWGGLPEEYREITRELWDKYKLVPKGASKSKREHALIFAGVGLDKYVAKNGTLAFLLPRSTIKASASNVFRGTMSERYKISRIFDVAELEPFEVKKNRPIGIVIINDEQENTKFPVPYDWYRRKSKTLPSPYDSLKDVLEKHAEIQLFTRPIANQIADRWIVGTKETLDQLRKIYGKSFYHAHSGVDCGLNAAYWVKIIKDFGDKIRVQNLSDIGRTGDVSQIVADIPKTYVFNYLLGKDVRRWNVKKPKMLCVLPHRLNGEPLTENFIEIEESGIHNFFSTNEIKLRARSSYKMMGAKHPYFSVFKIGAYTFSPWKVVWRYVSGGYVPDFQAAIVGPLNESDLGQGIIVPDSKLMLVAVKNEDEAYYLVGLLNSYPVRAFVRAFSIETQITPEILSRIFVSEYDSNNIKHKKIVELAKEMQETLKNEVEDDLSIAVGELYDLKRKDIFSIKNYLDESEEGLWRRIETKIQKKV